MRPASPFRAFRPFDAPASPAVPSEAGSGSPAPHPFAAPETGSAAERGSSSPPERNVSSPSERDDPPALGRNVSLGPGRDGSPSPGREVSPPPAAPVRRTRRRLPAAGTQAPAASDTQAPLSRRHGGSGHASCRLNAVSSERGAGNHGSGLLRPRLVRHQRRQALPWSRESWLRLRPPIQPRPQHQPDAAGPLLRGQPARSPQRRASRRPVPKLTRLPLRPRSQRQHPKRPFAGPGAWLRHRSQHQRPRYPFAVHDGRPQLLRRQQHPHRRQPRQQSLRRWPRLSLSQPLLRLPGPLGAGSRSTPEPAVASAPVRRTRRPVTAAEVAPEPAPAPAPVAQAAPASPTASPLSLPPAPTTEAVAPPPAPAPAAPRRTRRAAPAAQAVETAPSMAPTVPVEAVAPTGTPSTAADPVEAVPKPARRTRQPKAAAEAAPVAPAPTPAPPGAPARRRQLPKLRQPRPFSRRPRLWLLRLSQPQPGAPVRRSQFRSRVRSSSVCASTNPGPARVRRRTASADGSPPPLRAGEGVGG